MQTTLWADERLYYPVHAVPYTPARHFAKGKNDPAFRTKLQIGADLAVKAQGAGFAFRAVCADSAYGDQDGFRAELADAGLPFVMALKPRRGTWAYGPDAHTPVDAARALAWDGPDDPGDWQPVRRAFRDGHTETWWAADAALGWWGPDGARRLVAATADPATLPPKATWYLVTNLPRPARPARAGQPAPGRTWPRSCGSAARASYKQRSRTSSGPFHPHPISRSAAKLSTPRSASAGPPGSPITRRRMRLHRDRSRGERSAAWYPGSPAAAPRALAASSIRAAFPLDRTLQRLVRHGMVSRARRSQLQALKLAAAISACTSTS